MPTAPLSTSAPATMPVPPPAGLDVASSGDLPAAPVASPTSPTAAPDATAASPIAAPAAPPALPPTAPPTDDHYAGAAPSGSVTALPSDPPPQGTVSPLALRIGTLLGGALQVTPQALEARRATYQALIADHEKSIAGLEAELQAIEQRIASKTNDANQLLDRKRRLLHDIAEKKTMATIAAGYGGVLAIFTFGASAAVGAGIAAAAGAALISLQSDLNNVERSITSVQNDVSSLQASSRAHHELQGTLRAKVDELRTARTELDAAAPVIPAESTPAELVDALQKGIAHDKKVIANLESQIEVLTAMKKTAVAYEAHLDGVIEKLKAGVAQLEQQVEASNRQLFGALMDVALVSFGASAVLRGEGILLSRKEALMAGYDLLHGDVEKTLTSLMRRMVAEGLLAAAGSDVLATTLAALVRRGSVSVDAKSAVRALADAARTPLSQQQRALLTLLEQVTAFDPTPLAEAVIAQPSVTDEQVDAIRALLA